MVQERLKQHFLEVLLTTSKGEIYTGGEILKRVDMLTRAFSCIGVDSRDTIGIYCENEMYGVATVLACMSYGVNFVVLDYTEDIKDTRVKMVLTGVTNGLLVSEEVLDESILTLDPAKIKITSKGWNYSVLAEDEKNYISKIFDIVNNVVGVHEELNEYTIDIPKNYIDGKELCYNFHNSISRGIYAASAFEHKSIYEGIIDSNKELYDNAGKALNDTLRGPLLMLEPFASLYDIINGIIAPILSGIHVIIGKSSTLYEVIHSMKYLEGKLLYINSNKLEALLKKYLREVPKWAKYICLEGYFLRRLFNNKLNSSIEHLLITNKIKERKLINSIKRKSTNLYVMSEVASFIAKGTYYKLPKRIWLTPRSNMLVITTGGDNEYGEINLKSKDLFESYLLNGALEEYFEDTVEQSEPKDLKGNFRTEDVGLLRNGKLLIKDKAKNIFVNQEFLVIETGKILTLAKRFRFIKEANIVKYDNSILLVVEPDVNYLEMKREFNTVEEILEEVKTFINRKVDIYSKIKEIILITSPEGLYRKNFKIVSRHF